MPKSRSTIFTAEVLEKIYNVIKHAFIEREQDIDKRGTLAKIKEEVLQGLKEKEHSLFSQFDAGNQSSVKWYVDIFLAIIKGENPYGANRAGVDIFTENILRDFGDKYKENVMKAIKAYDDYKSNGKVQNANNKANNAPQISDKQESAKVKNNIINQPLNQILFGPPGTGKTYHTITKAVEIIDGKSSKDREKDKKRFEELKEAGRIVFVTFHQSYGYEEFVEGIKPDFDSGELKYKISSGIFKEICEKAQDCIKNANNIVSNTKRLDITRLVNDFANNVRSKIDEGEEMLISAVNIKDGTPQSFSAGGIAKQQTLKVDTIIRDYENFLSGKISKYRDIKPTNQSKSSHHGNALYYWDLYRRIKEFQDNSKEDYWGETKNYVLIIDEINRGNISKIFGELITLIEESKRVGNKEELKVKLPYSGEEFGVPNNLYIIGTMNTADRSIALMDTALRRRFDFVEMMPDYEKLSGDIIEGINLQKVLKTINERVEYLYDRDHTIGHAYLMGIKTRKELESVFKKKIIPLLQEYFYDDWKKIGLVLGEGFIEKQETPKQIKDVFGDEEIKDIYIVKSEFDWSAFKTL
jgi:5-methylcytosine-specific restriction protein B